MPKTTPGSITARSRADDATVELGGWLTDTSHNLDSLDLDSNIVELIGTLDNRHRTLALVPGQTSSTGSWSLNGGRIDGGTITTTAVACALAAASRHPRRRDPERNPGHVGGRGLRGGR